MKLYHRTTRANAVAILREGFRDGEGRYGTDQLFRGVWLSDVPLDANDFGGRHEDTVLAVELNCDESRLAEYEWVEEGEGKGYREWFILAALLAPLIARVEVEEAAR
jgi:hypothetical protein